MKKLLLITMLAFISISLKAQYYQIGYDSVRIKPKLKLGTVTTGQATDSVLVKSPDGTIYKIARSSLVQTLSLGATNGNVAISGGNNVTLNTLGQSATYNGDANAVARFALAGLSTYVNGSSSTNFPSTGGGAGILLVRIAGSSSGAIEINRPTGSDSTIYIRNGNTSLGWSPWMALPSKVALALKANTANATFTGVTSAAQFKLSALNTAPANATATGNLGEIRVTNGFIFVCIATNTWVRSPLASW